MYNHRQKHVTYLYYLGVSLLFTHEMDAVLHSEWQLLYVLRNLPDAAAADIFILLHVPLFFVFFWLSHHPTDKIRNIFRLSVSAFLIVHALLHFRLSDAPLYNFHGWLSELLIYGAGLVGFVYIILTVMRKNTRTDGDDY